MRRNISLIRDILFYCESYCDGKTPATIRPSGHDLSQIESHVEWLVQGGFLRLDHAATLDPKAMLSANVTGLTWHGHELLDSIRHDAVWSKIEERIRQEGGHFPVEIIQAMGLAFSREVLAF